MKKLRDFMTFQADSFFKEKLLQVVSINEWIDYNTKERLGTKVEVVIVSDKTPYSVKCVLSIAGFGIPHQFFSPVTT